MAGGVDEDGPPLLRGPHAVALRARWTGDPTIDAALAQPTARAAAAELFGPDRATRPVTRALAASLAGPSWFPPGRDAALAAVCLVLAVDPEPHGPDAGHRLAPDDLATVLAASAADDAPVRVASIPAPGRASLRRLLHGWPRRRRRRLLVELLTDEHLADVAVWGLRLMDTRRVPPPPLPRDTSPPGVVLRLLDLVEEQPLPTVLPRDVPAAAFAGRPRVAVDDGLEVRIPTTREQLVVEGERFDNCLASAWSTLTERGHVIATVHHGPEAVAAVEVDPIGDVRQLLGPRNRRLDGGTQRRVEGALVAAGILDAVEHERPKGPAEEIAARIACLAALVLVDDLDLDARLEAIEPGTVREVGAVAFALLGPRAAWLRPDEGDELHQADTRHAEPLDDRASAVERDRLLEAGALLLASHVDDPTLARLDGSAPFRRAVRDHLRRTLLRVAPLDERPPDPGLRLLRDDPAVPGPVRRALGEVLTTWRTTPV